MADVFTERKRSLVMASIRSKSNRDTELKLVKILKGSRIIGWRRNQVLVGKPDFVFRKQRLAIFVDGCFWHCCPTHGRQPTSNTSYWSRKLERNKLRDRSVNRYLRKNGWHVLRIWEHELRYADQIAKKIVRALKKSELAKLR